MPPAGAALRGRSDKLPSYQVHCGSHLPSHTVFASRHAVGVHTLQNVLKKITLELFVGVGKERLAS